MDSKKIVCIRQFRVPINDYVYELPAGLIDGMRILLMQLQGNLMKKQDLNC